MSNYQNPLEYCADDFQECCYSLETQQIHIVHIDPAKKTYFVTLPMSATGNEFNLVAFQIDTSQHLRYLS